MLRAPTLNASRFVNSARSSHASSHGRVGTTPRRGGSGKTNDRGGLTKSRGKVEGREEHAARSALPLDAGI
jgi:hypothetical protein